MKEIDYTAFTEFDNHKLVMKIEDDKSGLVGFIAIHNDTLGIPAVGGTRMFPYKSENDALIDVLKLSKTMTYKCAMAKTPHGGAKGVIIGDPKKDKTEKLLKSYAQKVNSLNGRFYTGEDVGITQDDVNTMLEVSDYFIGRPASAGDPSPYAALSTFYSIESAVLFAFKKDSVKGISVAVKGLGKTGKELVRLLFQAGAEVYASDIDPLACDLIKKEFPQVKIVDNDKIRNIKVDVYAPCALGNEFSIENVQELKAKIICGSANNQLADTRVSELLFERGIIYIPDYISNSGGLIDVVDELEKDGYKRNRVLLRINNVRNTVNGILNSSLKNNKSPLKIADKIVKVVLKAIKTS